MILVSNWMIFIRFAKTYSLSSVGTSLISGSPTKGPSPSMLRKVVWNLAILHFLNYNVVAPNQIQVLLDKRETLCAHAAAWFKKFDRNEDGASWFCVGRYAHGQPHMLGIIRKL